MANYYRNIRETTSFSALQRAENSSIYAEQQKQQLEHLFQCSSASRKFLNSQEADCSYQRRSGFSALQRAENSSIVPAVCVQPELVPFQCSSASRKFLNRIALFGYAGD